MRGRREMRKGERGREERKRKILKLIFCKKGEVIPAPLGVPRAKEIFG